MIYNNQNSFRSRSRSRRRHGRGRSRSRSSTYRSYRSHRYNLKHRFNNVLWPCRLLRRVRNLNCIHNLPKTFHCIFYHHKCMIGLVSFKPVCLTVFFLPSVGHTVEVIPEVAHIIGVGDPGLLMQNV